MSEIKDSGERTEFETGAVRDMHEGKGRFDLLPWEAIWEVAKHCERGAIKYGERNCERGIPIHSLIDSAMRHLAKYMMGWDDEPHLVAAAWNVLFAIWMEKKHQEMQDIPARETQTYMIPAEKDDEWKKMLRDRIKKGDRIEIGPVGCYAKMAEEAKKSGWKYYE